ncbi:MAG: TVP38/TMEM64 family protein, partial [Acidobacteriota bacterium]|nr:TVP38/TMEM64 family protein [Acidobacteriota bacterium]
GLVLVVILVERQFHLSAGLKAARIEDRLQAAGPLAPLAFVLVMAVTVLLPVPTFPLDVLAGRLFGPFFGTLYAVSGATLGASLSFLLARWLGRDFVARYLKGHIHFCGRCSDKLLTKVVFFTRLIPAVSFDVVSYAAGLTAMSLTRFALASFLGMLPLTFAYVLFGPLLSIGNPITWLGAVAAAALLFLLPRWIERSDLFGMRRHFRHEDVPML